MCVVCKFRTIMQVLVVYFISNDRLQKFKYSNYGLVLLRIFYVILIRNWNQVLRWGRVDLRYQNSQ